MAQRPLIVMTQPRQKPRRRFSARRWFRRKATRTATAAANPDNMMRAVGLIQGGVILLGPTVREGMRVYDTGWTNVIQNSLGILEATPASKYFKAAAPSIAAEGAIGTRKLVKKALSKGFGLFK